MPICIVCHKRKATVPDRESLSLRYVRKVCGQCHAQRLLDDLKRIGWKPSDELDKVEDNDTNSC